MRIFRIGRDVTGHSVNGSAIWSAPDDPTVQEGHVATGFHHTKYEPISEVAAESTRSRYVTTGGREETLYPILDPFSGEGHAVVDEAVVDEVDALDPPAHTILPILHGVYSIPDQRVVSKPYSVLRAYLAIDCVDMERPTCRRYRYQRSPRTTSRIPPRVPRRKNAFCSAPPARTAIFGLIV
ncbi:MAG: hypothetical protein AAF674_13425 [Pseudomonadota bacterium]